MIKLLILTISFFATLANSAKPYDQSCPKVVEIFNDNSKSYKKAKWCFEIDLEKKVNQNEKKFKKCIKKRKVKNDDHVKEFLDCYTILLDEAKAAQQQALDASSDDAPNDDAFNDDDTTPKCYQDIENHKKNKKWIHCLQNENLLDEKKHDKCMKKAGKKVKPIVKECFEIMKETSTVTVRMNFSTHRRIVN